MIDNPNLENKHKFSSNFLVENNDNSNSVIVLNNYLNEFDDYAIKHNKKHQKYRTYDAILDALVVFNFIIAILVFVGVLKYDWHPLVLGLVALMLAFILATIEICLWVKLYKDESFKIFAYKIQYEIHKMDEKIFKIHMPKDKFHTKIVSNFYNTLYE